MEKCVPGRHGALAVTPGEGAGVGATFERDFAPKRKGDSEIRCSEVDGAADVGAGGGCAAASGATWAGG